MGARSFHPTTGSHGYTARRAGPGDRNYYYTGLDREDNTLGYLYSNLVPCCKVCNRAKSTMTRAEFLTWIGRAHLHSQVLA